MPKTTRRPLSDFRVMMITLPLALIGAFALMFVTIAPIDWSVL